MAISIVMPCYLNKTHCKKRFMTTLFTYLDPDGQISSRQVDYVVYH